MYFFKILFISYCAVVMIHAEQPWTSCHTHFIAQESNKQLVEKKVDWFKQLIFSWHAQRPCKGYFRFFVRVHDAQTKQWLGWHKAIEWGAGVQRSFLHKTATDDYLHVRLEMKQHYADAYQIKVEIIDNADISLLKSITVCTSRFDLFNPEHGSRYSQVSSVQLANVPRISQMMLDHPDYDALCSPTSLTMMSSFLLKKKIDPLVSAEQVFDNGLGVYGSWPFNIAYANEVSSEKHSFLVKRLHSFHELLAILRQKKPVVVSVRGALQGAPKSYPNGHLMVVIGYDAARRQVICHDPAIVPAQKVVKRYRLSDFLAAWERSHRLAYIAQDLMPY